MLRTCVVILLTAVGCSAGAPSVIYPDDTPGDLIALSDGVFADFVAAFPAQESCIGTVEIHGRWELDDRALYRPDARVIEVRIPATAPHLTASLVHELGHHLEFACDSHRDVRPAFLQAIGHSEWALSDTYENDPRELWSEAVVRYVTGQPDTRRVLSVTPEAVAVVAAWANG